MIVIECVGLPGSGKTTFCNRTTAAMGFARVEALNEDGWRSMPVAARLALCARTLVRQIPSIVAMTRTAVRLRLWSSPDACRRWLQLPLQRQWICEQMQQARQRGAHGIVLDQGSLVVIWSVLDRAGIRSVDVASLVQLVAVLYAQLPVRCLYFDVEPAIAAERIGRRSGGMSRFDGRPTDLVARHLAGAAGLMTCIRDAAIGVGLPVRTLQATHDPDGVAASVSRQWLMHGVETASLEVAHADTDANEVRP